MRSIKDRFILLEIVNCKQLTKQNISFMKNTNIVYSVPVTQKKQGETPVYRHPDAKNKLLNPEIQTMQQLWAKSAKEHAKNKCLEEHTYQEVDRLTSSLGSWLVKNNFQLVYIHSRNRTEWSLVDIACWKYGIVSVPLYDTLGKEAIQYTLKLTEGKVIFSSKESVDALMRISPNTLNLIKKMVLLDDLTDDQKNKLKNFKVELVPFKTVLNQKIIQPKKVKPNDILSIIFTSGTTGVPKGAVMTNYNLASQAPASKKQINLSNDQIHFSYLPLPHAYERVVQAMMLLAGAQICYGSGVVANFVKDLQRVRPTFLPVVPRILNMLYEIVRPFSHVSKEVAAEAFKEKKANYQKGIKTSKYDETVFKKPNDLFGGRLRFIVTGSAPIAPQILNFFKIVLNAKIFEGYGQTQTTAITFLVSPDDSQSGHVGGPTQLLEFKLVDIPQMKYFSTDQQPRGQICARGLSIFKEYYKDKKNTEETISRDGWHHSGDVGALLPNGAVKIIDRKKNIYKLSQGQYIAPQKIENVYKQNPIVSDVFLYGDSLRDYNIAIVVPNKDVLAQHGISGTLQQISTNPKASQTVRNILNETGTKGGLFGFEQAKKVYLYPQPFATTGILTNTMKLQRHQAKQFFKDIIEKTYQSKTSENEK